MAHLNVFWHLNIQQNMAHFTPCKTITREKTTKLFIGHVFRYHGLLKNIISTYELQIASKFGKGFLNYWAWRWSYCQPSTLKWMDKLGVNQSSLGIILALHNQLYQDNWSNLLATTEFAYNNIVFTPFFANHGLHHKFSHPRCEQHCESYN